MLLDFFVIDEKEQDNHLQVLDLLDELKQQAQQSEFDSTLPLESVLVLLNTYITSTAQAGRLSASVNFTSMNNLTGIAFKKVCLLGMNYDSWPAKTREPGFDLLHAQGTDGHRQGDRNKANDARYQTLQMILSAQSSLYMSFVGSNIQNGDKIPPSVLVSELLDCCQLLGIPVKEIAHPIHAFSKGNFNGKNLNSHSASWLDVAKAAGLGDKQRTALFDQPLELAKPIKAVDIDSLLQFFKNPQSSFLRSSLGIYISDQASQWDNA